MLITLRGFSTSFDRCDSLISKCVEWARCKIERILVVSKTKRRAFISRLTHKYSLRLCLLSLSLSFSARLVQQKKIFHFILALEVLQDATNSSQTKIILTWESDRRRRKVCWSTERRSVSNRPKANLEVYRQFASLIICCDKRFKVWRLSSIRDSSAVVCDKLFARKTNDNIWIWLINCYWSRSKWRFRKIFFLSTTQSSHTREREANRTRNTRKVSSHVIISELKLEALENTRKRVIKSLWSWASVCEALFMNENINSEKKSLVAQHKKNQQSAAALVFLIQICWIEKRWNSFDRLWLNCRLIEVSFRKFPRQEGKRNVSWKLERVDSEHSNSEFSKIFFKEKLEFQIPSLVSGSGLCAITWIHKRSFVSDALHFRLVQAALLSSNRFHWEPRP